MQSQGPARSSGWIVCPPLGGKTNARRTTRNARTSIDAVYANFGCGLSEHRTLHSRSVYCVRCLRHKRPPQICGRDSLSSPPSRPSHRLSLPSVGVSCRLFASYFLFLYFFLGALYQAFTAAWEMCVDENYKTPSIDIIETTPDDKISLNYSQMKFSTTVGWVVYSKSPDIRYNLFQPSFKFFIYYFFFRSISRTIMILFNVYFLF